jgi:drug/metabolite transporter (DMT)-like permease
MTFFDKEFKSSTLGVFAIASAAMLWSIDALLRRNLYALPALEIVFLEHFIGFVAISFLIFKNWAKLKNLSSKTWFSLVWVSLFGGVLGTLFYTMALGYINYINLSVVVLLQKMQPLFAMILASIVLKERLNKSFYFWASIALIGGYFVTFPFGKIISIDGGKNLIASLFALAAAFAWGSSTVMGKYSLKNLDTWIVTPVRLGITTLISGIGLLFIKTNTFNYGLTQEQWISIIAIVISSGTVALGLYYFGLKFLKASQATIVEMVWPLSAICIDWFIFDKVLTISQLIGAIILLSGVAGVSRPTRNAIPQ